ncbi:MAG: hypothetical protein Q8R76_11120 [Candidatus Omnitrophota bacterium]|nr:hypothetical protein [Candidatus Omnitrophota bacterium]
MASSKLDACWTEAGRRSSASTVVSGLLLGAGLLLALLYAASLSPWIDIGYFSSHDPASYIGRAVALVNGAGYGEQYANDFYPTRIHSPGMALILTPVVAIFGVNFFALKMFMLCLAAGLAYAMGLFFERFLGKGSRAGAALLLFMASPVIMGLSHRVLAEIPLFACAAVTLVMLDRYLRDRESSGATLLWAALFSWGAFFLKPTAGLLGAGWLLWLHPLYRNRVIFRKVLIFTLLAAAPIAAWTMWQAATPAKGYFGQTYADMLLLENHFELGGPAASLADWIERIRGNVLWGFMSNAAAILVAPLWFMEGTKEGFLIGAPIMAVITVVGVWRFIKEPTVLEGFFVASALVCLLVIQGMSERYTAILYPAIIVYFMNFTGSGRIGRIGRWLMGGLIITALAASAVSAKEQAARPYRWDVAADYVALAEEVRDELPADSTCVAPLISHWQILTRHLCYVDWEESGAGIGEAGYYVIPAEGMDREGVRFKDFENDVLYEAQEIERALRGHGLAIRTVFENDTFRIVKSAGV